MGKSTMYKWSFSIYSYVTLPEGSHNFPVLWIFMGKSTIFHGKIHHFYEFSTISQFFFPTVSRRLGSHGRSRTRRQGPLPRTGAGLWAGGADENHRPIAGGFASKPYLIPTIYNILKKTNIFIICVYIYYDIYIYCKIYIYIVRYIYIL